METSLQAVWNSSEVTILHMTRLSRSALLRTDLYASDGNGHDIPFHDMGPTSDFVK